MVEKPIDVDLEYGDFSQPLRPQWLDGKRKYVCACGHAFFNASPTSLIPGMPTGVGHFSSDPNEEEKLGTPIGSHVVECIGRWSLYIHMGSTLHIDTYLLTRGNSGRSTGLHHKARDHKREQVHAAQHGTLIRRTP